MHAYIINMDAATERWQYVSQNFAATGIPYTRIAGVNGRQLQLPIPEYDEASYRRRHGQRTNLGAVGCFLSHLKALRTFLASSNQYGIIAEDDAKPAADLKRILAGALQYRDAWDILRLCGFHDPHPRAFASLGDGRSHLCVCFTRLCGTGAYFVSRHAAEVLLRELPPMFVPIDHAIDREWVFGLRTAAVMPLPVSQESHNFGSQTTGNLKLPWFQRYWSVFPYRAWNEASRWVHRGRQYRQAVRDAAAASHLAKAA